MKTKNLVLAGVVALLGVAFAAPAHAQSSTSGAVQGVVTDKANGEALIGVTVVATSTALQGPQSAISEANGTYKITNLPPGDYEVTFYYADISVKKTGVRVRINKTTPVYMKLDTAQAAGETITIKDRAPTIDPTSTTQGITLDQDYTRNIPVPGRDFEATLGAAAGSQGDALGVSFSGSTSLENQYVVDGVNTTGLSYGTVGSPVINDFIEEIEIITGGYQAEYGRATGGVVNVVTKSGSNEFHGSVFSRFTNDFIAAAPDRAPSQATSIDPNNITQYDLSFGFDLGGPIIKDKLWFYVGFAPRLISVDTQRITKRRTDCRTIQPDGTMSTCDPANGDGEPDVDENGFIIYEDIPGGERTLNSQAQEYQFVSKINYAMSPEHQGQFTFSGTPFSTKNNGVYGLPQATSFDVSSVTTDMAAKWTSKLNNNNTEVEAVAGWHRSKFVVGSVDSAFNDVPRQNLVFGNLGTWSDLGYESPQTAAACKDGAATDPYPFIENCPDVGVGYRVGGPGGLADDLEQRYSGKVGVTQRVKAAGNHEIKAGIDAEQNLLNKPRSFSGDVFYNVLLGNSVSGGNFNRVQAERWVRVAPPGDMSPEFDQICGTDANGDEIRCEFLGPTAVEGNTFNWAGYLRDSWQIMPNLTLNAGLRYEEQRLRYAKFIQNSPDPFTGELRGKNAMTMTGMWAPRIGLIYDWTKEGRSKIYANWGRFYESIPMDINDRSFGGETLLTQNFDSTSQCGNPAPGFGGPDGTQCGTDGSRPALGEDLFGGSGVLVEPGVKPQYLDEIVLGVEYEVLEDLKLGVSYQNRRLGRVLEDVSVDNAATYILANPGEFSTSEETALEGQIMDETDPDRKATLQGQLDQYRGIRGFDKPRRDYNALQFTATKRFSKNFFMQGSYTYQRTTGNFPGLFSADNGQVDPNISSQYDLIELLANRDGPLPQDRPHYFKLDGYYTFDFKKAGALTTGTRIRALSGTPVNALGAHYLYGFDESFLLPRGEMGRTPTTFNIDLHFGYGRDLGRGMHLEVFTDFFSIFNQQDTASRDATYTFDNANPVVGGKYEDLVWVKAQTSDGAESSDPVSRNLNFLNTAGRYAPFYTELGARLTF